MQFSPGIHPDLIDLLDDLDDGTEVIAGRAVCGSCSRATRACAGSSMRSASAGSSSGSA
jgi:hypothetical protein